MKINQIIPFKTNKLAVRFAEKNSYKHIFELRKNNFSYDKKTNTYTWNTNFTDLVCPKFDNLPKIQSDMGGDIYIQSSFVGLLEIKVINKSSGTISLSIINTVFSFYGNGFQINPSTNFQYFKMQQDGNNKISYSNYGKNLNFPLNIPMKIVGYKKNDTNQSEEIAKITTYIDSL